MIAIGGQPDYALGSVHVVTRDGTLVIASAASRSQLATYAWGRGQCHLHGRRAEAGAHPGSRAPADLPVQPAAGRRPRTGCLPAAIRQFSARNHARPLQGERDGTGRGKGRVLGTRLRR